MKDIKDNHMMVTVRVKKTLSELYKVTMIRTNQTITDNLIEHIKKQVDNYHVPDYTQTINDNDYVKINFRIERELYTNYKVQMVLNHTTPTADITRHILKTVENS
ncbi:hypothetical protein [Rummeliibacillus pycnus]|uniref:hypothetical protein n=1 Tax=Rummeliibacillus pycnus TaxID=101070 RepID=UPI003D275C7D